MNQIFYKQKLTHEELGAEDIMVDTHAYVTAHWPASAGAENLPTRGFCCHLDTASSLTPQLDLTRAAFVSIQQFIFLS